MTIRDAECKGWERRDGGCGRRGEEEVSGKEKVTMVAAMVGLILTACRCCGIDVPDVMCRTDGHPGMSVVVGECGL